MKKVVLTCFFLFSAAGLYAQKQDSLVKLPVVNTSKAKQLNLKLLQLQSTLKQMETKLNEVKQLMEKVEKDKMSLREMGQQDMLLLQQLMEKKSQLESMISNVMKAGYEAGQQAIQALKAS